MESRKKAGVGILVSDKIDFKTNKDQKRQRRAIHNGKRINEPEELTILNIYAPNSEHPDT